MRAAEPLLLEVTGAFPVAPPSFSEPGTSAAAATAGGGVGRGLPAGALPLPGKVSTSNMLGRNGAPRAAPPGAGELRLHACQLRAVGTPWAHLLLRRLQVVAMAMMAASSSAQLPASTMMMIAGVSHCSAGPTSRAEAGRARASGFRARDASPRPPPAVTEAEADGGSGGEGRPPSDMTSRVGKTGCWRALREVAGEHDLPVRRSMAKVFAAPAAEVEGPAPVGTFVCYLRPARTPPPSWSSQRSGTTSREPLSLAPGIRISVVVLVQHPHLHQGTAGELRELPAARLDAHVELAKRLVVEAARAP